MDESVSYVETRSAQSALIDQGANLITDDVIRNISSSNVSHWMPFLALNAGTYSYDTYDSVDIDSFNLALGVARTFSMKSGYLSVGAGFQYGRGEYESSAEDIHAEGDIEYTGAFIFAKYKLKNGVYTEASISTGSSEADYTSTEMPMYDAVGYYTNSSYWGANIGLGKEFTLKNGSMLDIYGKYFYSHLDGDTSTLTNACNYVFDDVDSSRLRLGIRYTARKNELSIWYAGVAYQFQFDSDTTATYKGYSTPSSNLEGSTCMLEAGVDLKFKGAKDLTLGIGITGWIGQQEGIEGTIRVKWDL